MARDRSGLAAGNVVLALAVLALAAALFAPLARQRAFEARLELAIAEVEQLRTRARSHRTQHGSWPAPADLAATAGGGAATERVGTTAGGAASVTESAEVEPADAGAAAAERGYRLEWNIWRGVRPAARSGSSGTPTSGAATPAAPGSPGVAAPPPPELYRLGSITLHTHDERLLAGLLGRFGDGISFVRDSSWTLLLAPAPGAPAAPSP